MVNICADLCYCVRAESVTRIVNLENENKRLRAIVDELRTTEVIVKLEAENERLRKEAAGCHAADCINAPSAKAENERLRAAINAIQQATIAGRVCDDVAWLDTITTLHDFCAEALEQGATTP